MINALEIAATHSTTYKLKYIILHCAVVIVIVDVNVVDVVVGVGIIVILVVVVVIVVIVSMLQVPAPRCFQKKKITVQHDLNMLFCTWETHLF